MEKTNCKIFYYFLHKFCRNKDFKICNRIFEDEFAQRGGIKDVLEERKTQREKERKRDGKK